MKRLTGFPAAASTLCPARAISAVRRGEAAKGSSIQAVEGGKSSKSLTANKRALGTGNADTVAVPAAAHASTRTHAEHRWADAVRELHEVDRTRLRRKEPLAATRGSPTCRHYAARQLHCAKR